MKRLLVYEMLAALDASLVRQVTTVRNSHAKTGISKSEHAAMVAFEKSLFASQQVDTTSGLLFAADGTGGATAALTTNYSFGTNSILKAIAAGQFIARSQNIFNNRAFNVSKDFPGTEGLGLSFLTSRTCHSVPNVGSMPEPRYFNIGTADAKARTADMPLYTLRTIKTTEWVQTQDPSRAMVSGLAKDIRRFKAPGLRGLRTRAPYFHDGTVKTTADSIAFYDKNSASSSRHKSSQTWMLF